MRIYYYTTCAEYRIGPYRSFGKAADQAKLANGEGSHCCRFHYVQASNEPLPTGTLEDEMADAW